MFSKNKKPVAELNFNIISFIVQLFELKSRFLKNIQQFIIKKLFTREDFRDNNFSRCIASIEAKLHVNWDSIISKEAYSQEIDWFPLAESEKQVNLLICIVYCRQQHFLLMMASSSSTVQFQWNVFGWW